MSISMAALLPVALMLHLSAVYGQSLTLLDTSNCVGGIGHLTTAPNCNFYETKLVECATLTQASAASACYCPQSVLNAIAG